MDLSSAKREKVKVLLANLSSPPGNDWQAENAPRVPFDEAVSSAPTEGGVYYFFRKDEKGVLYVGKAGDIRRRMKQYRSQNHNEKLKLLIDSGDAEVCWRLTPYPGWFEALEHRDYKEIHGDTPTFNQKEGGDSIEHAEDAFFADGIIIVVCMFIFLSAVGGVAGYFVNESTGAFIGTGIGFVLFVVLSVVLGLTGGSEPEKGAKGEKTSS